MSSFRLRNRQNPLQGTIAERELARIDAGLPLNPSKKPETAQMVGLDELVAQPDLEVRLRQLTIRI